MKKEKKAEFARVVNDELYVGDFFLGEWPLTDVEGKANLIRMAFRLRLLSEMEGFRDRAAQKARIITQRYEMEGDEGVMGYEIAEAISALPLEEI